MHKWIKTVYAALNRRKVDQSDLKLKKCDKHFTLLQKGRHRAIKVFYRKNSNTIVPPVAE